jgi:hypothetical protein
VRLLLHAATLSALLAAGPCRAAGDVVPFAETVLSADPEVRIEDAYKWLFHATRGGEHAIRDESAARAWLAREWAALGPPEPGEALVVPLRPDGALVRLNLRPFKARGGNPDALLTAFVRSARSFQSSAENFEAAWRELGRRLSDGPSGPLDGAAWSRLDAEARAKGYPAWHHSTGYEAARHPAYRVLTGDEARRLTASDGDAGRIRGAETIPMSPERRRPAGDGPE